MLASASGLSFTALFGKLGNNLFSLPSLIFWRYSVSFLFCLLFFWLKGSLRNFLKQGDYKLHFLRALLVLLSQYSFYYYLKHNNLLNATVLLNLGPLFIPIIEWGVLKKRIGRSTWIGVAISMIGAVLILQPNKTILSFTSFVGLLSGIAQGASQVVFGINSRKENADLGILNLFFLCSLFSMIPYLIGAGSLWLGQPQWTWGAILIAFLAVASLANQIFRSLAYKHASPSKLAAFFYLSVILSGLWDWIFFHHTPNLLSICGALLVILGGTLKIWMHYSKTKTPR